MLTYFKGIKMKIIKLIVLTMMVSSCATYKKIEKIEMNYCEKRYNKFLDIDEISYNVKLETTNQKFEGIEFVLAMDSLGRIMRLENPQYVVPSKEKNGQTFEGFYLIMPNNENTNLIEKIYIMLSHESKFLENKMKNDNSSLTEDQFINIILDHSLKIEEKKCINK